MEKEMNNTQKRAYIQFKNVAKIERYCEKSELKFSEAVNQILSEYFLENKPENDPATKKDIRKLTKEIKLVSMMFQPAFLDLLEASSYLKYANKEKEELVNYGREFREKYKDLFNSLEEMA